MPTYDIAFAKKFAEVSAGMVSRELEDNEARRVVAYISRLSMELSLKSFLECADIPVVEIRKHWHKLRDLLAEVDKCEIETEFSLGNRRWVPASSIRSIDIRFMGYTVNLGVILEAEDHGASIYPNEIRYGEMPKDFPPEALSAAAVKLAEWVQTQSKVARRK